MNKLELSRVTWSLTVLCSILGTKPETFDHFLDAPDRLVGTARAACVLPPVPCYTWNDPDDASMSCDFGTTAQSSPLPIIQACNYVTLGAGGAWYRAYMYYLYQFDLITLTRGESGNSGVGKRFSVSERGHFGNFADFAGGVFAQSKCTVKSFNTENVSSLDAIAMIRSPTFNPFGTGPCQRYQVLFWLKLDAPPVLATDARYGLEVQVQYGASMSYTHVWGSADDYVGIIVGEWSYVTAEFNTDMAFGLNFLAHHLNNCTNPIPISIDTIVLRTGAPQTDPTACSATTVSTTASTATTSSTPSIVTASRSTAARPTSSSTGITTYSTSSASTTGIATSSTSVPVLPSSPDVSSTFSPATSELNTTTASGLGDNTTSRSPDVDSTAPVISLTTTSTAVALPVTTSTASTIHSDESASSTTSESTSQEITGDSYLSPTTGIPVVYMTLYVTAGITGGVVLVVMATYLVLNRRAQMRSARRRSSRGTTMSPLYAQPTSVVADVWQKNRSHLMTYSHELPIWPPSTQTIPPAPSGNNPEYFEGMDQQIYSSGYESSLDRSSSFSSSLRSYETYDHRA